MQEIILKEIYFERELSKTLNYFLTQSLLIGNVIKNKRGLKLVTSCSSGYKTSSETDYKWENKNFIKKADTSFQKQTMSYYLFEILLFIIYYELLFNVVYIIHLLNKLSYFPFLDVTCLVACLKCNRRPRKVMSYMMSEV